MRFAAAILLALATSAARAEDQPSTVGDTAVALFAGGCFWCMEPPFDKTEGVLETISGYAGGSQADATYKRVSSGRTDHYEVIRIQYDPAKVAYATLLEVFWRNVDPFDANGQFCDKGPQYRAAIFALNDEQRKLAEESKAALAAQAAGRGEVQTEILPPAEFFPAEAYHQDYYKKNSIRYKYYRWGCGRDRRLKQLWGD